VVAISQAPSPESNPNSPSPVITTVDHASTIESMIGQKFGRAGSSPQVATLLSQTNPKQSRGTGGYTVGLIHQFLGILCICARIGDCTGQPHLFLAAADGGSTSRMTGNARPPVRLLDGILNGEPPRRAHQSIGRALSTRISHLVEKVIRAVGTRLLRLPHRVDCC